LYLIFTFFVTTSPEDQLTWMRAGVCASFFCACVKHWRLCRAHAGIITLWTCNWLYLIK